MKIALERIVIIIEYLSLFSLIKLNIKEIYGIVGKTTILIILKGYISDF